MSRLAARPALWLGGILALVLFRVPAAAAQGGGRELAVPQGPVRPPRGELPIPPRAAAGPGHRDPEPWIRRAIAAMAARDYDAGVAAADSARALAPDRAAVQLVVGQAYLSHARDRPGLGAIGRVKQGRAAVERAIVLDPDNLDARATLLQFLLQAPRIVGGSRDGARAQAREIERRDPRRGLLARLDVAVAGGRQEEIRAVYRDAIPRLAPPADGGPAGQGDVALARAFLGAAERLKDRKLREELVEQVRAAGRPFRSAA